MVAVGGGRDGADVTCGGHGESEGVGVFGLSSTSSLMIPVEGQQTWQPHLQSRKGTNLETMAFSAYWTLGTRVRFMGM